MLFKNVFEKINERQIHRNIDQMKKCWKRLKTVKKG